MSSKSDISNFNNDFTPKVVLVIREAAKITSNEIIGFINSNNRQRARISQVDINPVYEKLFNYYWRFFNFQSLILNDKESLFKNLQDVAGRFEEDTDFIERLKVIIKKEVNPLLDEYEQENEDYIPAIYDDLTFFSMDIKSLIDKIELRYFDNTEVKKIEAENSIVQLQSFDASLYNQIISSPELIYSVDWRQFEYILAKILATFEYEVELKKGTKDGGIDIIAIKKDDFLGGHKYLIQAKKWKDKVGVEPVQRLAFLKDHYAASKACLVTTSTFTKGAWELAKMYPWQLELKDYNGLLDWIKFAKMKK